MIAAWEWANLAGFHNNCIRLGYASIVGLLCLLMGAYKVSPVYWLVAAVLWWCLAFVMVRQYSYSQDWNLGKLSKLFLGIMTLLPSWIAMVTLKNNFGGLPILLLLSLVWASDVGAYFIGKQFGQHKLAEQVSPKKTIEGLFGGIIFSVCIAIIVGLYLNFSFGKGLALIALSIIISLISALGDLLESLFKRECGVKDSGHILPGHGGILDRIDSLTAALPLFALALIVSGS